MGKSTPNPPAELVDQHLKRFIAEVEALYKRHQVAAGYADRPLEVF
jgi:hypothetical protein